MPHISDWKSYDCPLCEKDDNEEWGCVDVRLFITEGMPGKRRAGRQVTPDDPPDIDNVDLRWIFKCDHDLESIYDALEDQIYDDFAAGEFQAHPREPDYEPEYDQNEWEGGAT